MSDTSTYSLRLPKSLKNEVAKMAKRDGTSLNQFIAMAVAEKVSVLETEDFFKERAKQANLKSFEDILFHPGGEMPREAVHLISASNVITSQRCFERKGNGTAVIYIT
ncbi:toxin-antitoxin system HicB family antitoxin [Nitrosomonas sp.]|uniref:toxin-antitoxin system HicB family antitoxin n=1 Tax=Nitrosomonas sp. TaxID=42353 RepID=UPI0025D05DE0|nr:toxin-antitoxin system HicB family antitoxin [Nitrosomonas sp.]